MAAIPPPFETEALPLLPELVRFARSLTRDDAAADDLVQDTMLMAFRRWAQYRPGSDCRAWLFTICRHRFYRVSSREQRQVPVETPELETLASVHLHVQAAEQGLGDAFERADVVAAVESAMAALPDPFREVAVLIDLHDFAYEEAASVLEIPVGTVRSRLFRARRMLQEQLLAHAADLGIAHDARLTPRSPSPSTLPLR